MIIYAITAILLTCLIAGVATLIMDIHNKKKGSYFNASSTNHNLPIIKASIGNREMYLLLDTGSSVSQLSTGVFLECVPPETMKRVQVSTAGIGGKTSEITTKAEVEITIGKYKAKGTVIGSDVVEKALKVLNSSNFKVEGILGADFIKRNKFILDFKDSMIYKK